MVPPYMVCPFTGQSPDMMYVPQSTGLSGQQFPQQFMPAPQFYPMQVPYGMHDDTDPADTSTAAVSPGDPPPVLSDNPATSTIVLFKELTAYPNYGNPSRNADILYTGNRGSWTFESPAFLFVPGNLRARITIRAVLDDHANVPASRYSARITINGTVVQDGRLPLEHGVPSGGIFTNWRDLTYNITNLRRTTRVTIENTSNVGANDWMAFDWMEIRFIPR